MLDPQRSPLWLPRTVSSSLFRASNVILEAFKIGEARFNLQPYRRTERHVDAEGVRGVRIRQNRTEIRINTAQNNIRKLQTALKLAEIF